jgi:hypothetical protein
MSWYASCESGHPYWSGPDEDKFSDAQADAHTHDQNVHGGVATAVVLKTDVLGNHLVNLSGVLHMVENGRARPHLAAAAQCQGNACGDVSVIWTGSGYDLSNHGGRNVRISIRFTFGLQCNAPSDVDLGPGQTQHFANGAYCPPYGANYI